MTDQTRGEPGARSGEDAGSAGAEFRLLLEALAYRAEEFLHGLGTPDQAADARSRHDDVGSRDACPMCAVLALLRGERPELTSPLVEQLAALLALVRRALSEHDRVNPHGGRSPDEHGEEHGSAGHNDAQEAHGSTKVQRIDVQRVRGNVIRPASAAGSPGASAEGAGC